MPATPVLPQVGHRRLSFHSSVIVVDRLKAFRWFVGSVPDKKEPTEAASLLRLVAVKRSLGGFHSFDQIIGILKRLGVRDLRDHRAQVAYISVYLGAFVTHWGTRIFASKLTPAS